MTTVTVNQNLSIRTPFGVVRLRAGEPTTITDLDVLAFLEDRGIVMQLASSDFNRPWSPVRRLDACGFGSREPDEFGVPLNWGAGAGPAVVLTDGRPGYAGGDVHALLLKPDTSVESLSTQGWAVLVEPMTRRQAHGLWVKFAATPAAGNPVHFLTMGFAGGALAYYVFAVRDTSGTDWIVCTERNLSATGTPTRSVAVTYDSGSAFRPLSGGWFPVVLSFDVDTRQVKVTVGEGTNAKTATLSAADGRVAEFWQWPTTLRLMSAGTGAVDVLFDDYLACHNAVELDDYPLLHYRQPEVSDLDLPRTTLGIAVEGLGTVGLGDDRTIPWTVVTAGTETTIHQVTAGVPPDNDTTYVRPSREEEDQPAHGRVGFFADAAAAATWADGKTPAFAHVGAKFRAEGGGGGFQAGWELSGIDEKLFDRLVTRGGPSAWGAHVRANAGIDLVDTTLPWRARVIGRGTKLRLTSLYAVYGYRSA